MSTWILKITLFAMLISLLGGGLQIRKSNQEHGNNDKTYAEMWQEVSDFDSKGLPRSALEVVEKIYAKAVTEKNGEQIIKSCLYRYRYMSVLEEGGQEKAIKQLETDIKTMPGLSKYFAHMLLAEMYSSYLQMNYYVIAERTRLNDFTPDDIATWDENHFKDKIIENYMLALNDALKRESVEKYPELIKYSKGAVEKTPTVFDLFSKMAYQKFSQGDYSYWYYGYRSNNETITNPDYCANADVFVGLNYAKNDSTDYNYYTFVVLRDWLSFRLLQKSDVSALVTADLTRLNYYKLNVKNPKAEEQWVKSMERLSKTHASHKIIADINYSLAAYYSNKGSKYSYTDTASYKNAPYNRKAWELYTQVVKAFPDSTISGKCKNSIYALERKEANLSSLLYAAPNQNIQTQISYRNIGKINISILKIDYEEYRKIERKYYEIPDKIKAITSASKLIRTEEITLSNETDFNTHCRDYMMKALPKGHYLILMHTGSDYTKETEYLSYNNVFVTDLCYTSRTDNDGAFEIFVLNRKTGAPVRGATVTFFTEKYSYITSSYVFEKEKQVLTDDKGIAVYLPKKDTYNNYQVDIKAGDDYIMLQDYFYSYNYSQDKNMREAVNIFTDRAIYRPGQTIHFKGIATKTNGIDSELLIKYTTTVELYDPNYQKISSLAVTTNSFGSFSGSFEIPTGLLTGSYRITCAGGSQYIRVEEYKRPGFEVGFKPIEDEYRLGDSIKVTGEVKTYAGSNLTGAKVTYTVSRMVSWRGWPYYYCYIEPKEVAFGECLSDDKGNFIIPFKAESENNIPSLGNAFFQYSVSASVTDINGETQRGATVVFASNKCILLSSNMPDRINCEMFDTLSIYATNTNGKDVKADVTISISEVKDPNILLQNNLFGKTDRSTYTREEWYAQNPGVEYSNETLTTLWETGRKVYEYKTNTGTNPKIAVASDMKKLEPGLYSLKLTTKDKYGNEVVEINQFTVYASKNKKMPYCTPSLFIQENTMVYPGEVAVVYAGTSFSETKLLYEIEVKNKIVTREWVSLDNELKRFEIPVTEEHRGNFTVHMMFMKNGRMYTSSFQFYVPWDNKQLTVKLETFRDKIEPGSGEEWTLKVTDNKGQPVSAEVLAGMYDASLDAFAANGWYFSLVPYYYSYRYWGQGYLGRSYARNLISFPYKYIYVSDDYMNFEFYGLLNSYGRYYSYDYEGDYDGNMDFRAGGEARPVMAQKVAREESAVMSKNSVMDSMSADESVSIETASGMAGANLPESAEKGYFGGKDKAGESMPPQIRSNFSETAFFYPHLTTDKNGIVSLSFKAPESLTRWNLMALAHTADLKTGTLTEQIVTAKDLMLMPNSPRFVRENDTLYFTAKISNMLETDISGIAKIQFYDAFSMKEIGSEILLNEKTDKTFSIVGGGNAQVSWKIHIPEGLSGLVYRITAQTEKHSDGEEKYIPVLPNRMLVTETMPLPIRGGQTKKFSFNRLINAENSNTLSHHNLTLEFTSNPAWYAVQALPYLAEYPYECAEQTFSRYYANSLATYIANSDPKIKQVFDAWKNEPDGNALKSNLEKNQDLKALLLEETPWVLQAQNESDRKRRVALLFDFNQMQMQTRSALNKLKKMQVSNGAWPWFEGMPEDRYITQHIVGGIGHLDKLGVVDIDKNNDLQSICKNAIGYIDNQLVKDYQYLKKYYTAEEMKAMHIGYTQIHYLYVRSFFINRYPIDNGTRDAFEYYLGQGEKYWLQNSRYMQGMLALSLNRYDRMSTAKAIIASLKENALQSEEMGMYWKSNSGYYWYEAPIETQSLMIEAFDEVSNDSLAVEEMQIWLLKQKQTQDWKTTKATADAIYALLLKGTSLLANDQPVEITMGDIKINPFGMKDLKPEAGTGYFSMSWTGAEIKPKMGDITVRKAGKGIAWGAVYWQYFEQLDKITGFEETPLKINKLLFVEQRKDGKTVMAPVSEKATLKVGDRVIVRIEIRVDRDMQYVHLKDMRAACFEPESVFSGYRYSGGLGYYQSIRDASMNFFVSYLNKGTYVFEYPLVVSQKGEFSNGITSMQCMYAPEFSSHSQGIRVKVE